MINRNIKVGTRIEVVKTVMADGKYRVGDKGTVTRVWNNHGGVDVDFDTGRHAALYEEEYVVIPDNSLEQAKATLEVTQRHYDLACQALEAAKATFKSADEAHGEAIKAYDKAYREDLTSWKESDIKNLMTVQLEHDDELRLMVINGDSIKFYNESGGVVNSTTPTRLLECLRTNYVKTDRTFVAK